MEFIIALREEKEYIGIYKMKDNLELSLNEI